MEFNQETISKPNSILLVDDDSGLREVVSIILADEGYNVLQAENGADALNVLGKLDPIDYPTCMILDLMMPIMGGNEFLETIESNPEHTEKYGKIPVIICSAEGKHRSYDQIVAKLEKPVNIEVLCSAIRGCQEH